MGWTLALSFCATTQVVCLQHEGLELFGCAPFLLGQYVILAKRSQQVIVVSTIDDLELHGERKKPAPSGGASIVWNRLSLH
jgi:hypothetical protein